MSVSYYRYSETTGEFLWTAEASIDPLQSKIDGRTVYLCPASATFTPVPSSLPENHVAVWRDGAWAVLPDHRQKHDRGGLPIEGTGTPYWLPGDSWDAPARYVTEPGPLPANALLAAPEKPLELVKADACIAVDNATSRAITAGFDFPIEGETLHFSYDPFDQQNFADTANVATLSISGIDGLPTSVTWNAYREGGELVRLAFTPQTFLALYTGGALVHKATQMEIGGQVKAAIMAASTAEEVNEIMGAFDS